jgi:hypothetical protein
MSGLIKLVWTYRALLIWCALKLFFVKQYKRRYSYTITHPYKHMHAHPIPISTFKRLSRLDLKIHEVGHQKRLTVDGDVTSH